jgi:hypothetical protein
VESHPRPGQSPAPPTCLEASARTRNAISRGVRSSADTRGLARRRRYFGSSPGRGDSLAPPGMGDRRIARSRSRAPTVDREPR